MFRSYELDVKFDETDHTFNDKIKLSRKNIVAIEEEWFSGMNLTDGATFPTALIKRAKINNQQENSRNTKWRIQEIKINNGWNTQLE